MRVVDLIEKTKRQTPLTRDELVWLIQGITSGTIPDYQTAAWLMAVVLRGMSAQETVWLTEAMAGSGERLHLASHGISAVDKHSTGGVGDKTTLVLGPMLAAADLTVAKMSGRGLGFTGGTLDKLESIPGCTVELTPDQFIRQAQDIGLVVASQSPTMAPADGKLYALRDVTGTIDSIPLIASSIMSKKIASGASALVLDVKTGGGAFMTSLEDAQALASAMVDIGSKAGIRVAAVLSSMRQPLGLAIGNALEVQEAIDTLSGQGPPDVLQLCVELGVQLLRLASTTSDRAEASRRLLKTIDDGSALRKFRAMVEAQGGNVSALEVGSTLLPTAKVHTLVRSAQRGFVHAIDARALGLSAVSLGAGRAKKEDPIDHAAGIVLHVKVGDTIDIGQPLATLHGSGNLADAERQVLLAFKVGEAPLVSEPLILQCI